MAVHKFRNELTIPMFGMLRLGQSMPTLDLPADKILRRGATEVTYDLDGDGQADVTVFKSATSSSVFIDQRDAAGKLSGGLVRADASGMITDLDRYDARSDDYVSGFSGDGQTTYEMHTTYRRNGSSETETWNDFDGDGTVDSDTKSDSTVQHSHPKNGPELRNEMTCGDLGTVTIGQDASELLGKLGSVVSQEPQLSKYDRNGDGKSDASVEELQDATGKVMERILKWTNQDANDEFAWTTVTIDAATNKVTKVTYDHDFGYETLEDTNGDGKADRATQQGFGGTISSRIELVDKDFDGKADEITTTI